MNDDVATAESNKTISSGKVSPKKKAPRHKQCSTTEEEIKNDRELSKNIDYILSDDVATADSEEQASDVTFTPRKKAQLHNKLTTKEQKTMDGKKLAEKVNYIFSDDVGISESDKQVSDVTVLPAKKAPHPEKFSTKEQRNLDDKKPAEDVDYILSDDVGIAECDEQLSDVTVLPTKKAQRPNKFSTEEQKNMDDKKLVEDIDFILNDDVTSADLKGKVPSGTVSPSKMAQTPKKESLKELKNTDGKQPANDDDCVLKEDVVSTYSNQRISSGKISPSTQKSNKDSTKEQNNSDDKKPAKDFDCALKNVVLTDSNKHSSSATVSPSTKPPRPKKSPTMEKKIMDDDDNLAKDVAYILYDDISTAQSNGQVSSGVVTSTKKTQRQNKYSTRKKDIMGEDKLANDIDFILNDDVNPAKINEQVSCNTVPQPKKTKRPKKSSKKGSNRLGDKNVANDIDSVLKDDIPEVEFRNQISPSKVSPKKRVSFQEADLTDDKLANDIECSLKEGVVEVISKGKISSSLGGIPTLKKESFTKKHCKQADDQLAKEIEFILNDDIFTDKSIDNAISSSPAEIPRSKTSNPKLTLVMDLDRILDPASIASPSQADDKLAKDMEYILNDDLVDVASNVPIPLRSGATRRIKKQSPQARKQSDVELLKANENYRKDEIVQSALHESISSSTEGAPRTRKKTSTRNSKNMRTAEEVANETDPKASITSTSPVSRLQSDFSSKSGLGKHQTPHFTRTKENTEDETLSKNIDYILKEEALPPPKTRNPNPPFAMDMNTQVSSPPAPVSCALPRSIRILVRNQDTQLANWRKTALYNVHPAARSCRVLAQLRAPRKIPQRNPKIC